MQLTQTLVVLFLGAGALAAEAAPQNFCRRLQTEREKDWCQRDRLEYCRGLEGTRWHQECRRNEDGPQIFGDISRGNPQRGPGPRPQGNQQSCNDYRWGDMPNRCIRDCQDRGVQRGRHPLQWCENHCERTWNRRDPMPSWCGRR